MLLEKDFRFPVRVSVEHLDPALYDRLEKGDQFVIYTDSLLLGVDVSPGNLPAKARTLIANLLLRDLACEVVDLGIHRVVWEIMHARDVVKEHAAERAAE